LAFRISWFLSVKQFSKLLDVFHDLLRHPPIDAQIRLEFKDALNCQAAINDFQEAGVLALFLNSGIRRICQADKKESLRLEALQPLPVVTSFPRALVKANGGFRIISQRQEVAWRI
jgi:hypothetical protein